MAQRMESVAPSGGVMLSESTARLVGDDAVLGERTLGAHQGRRCRRAGLRAAVRARSASRSEFLDVDVHRPRVGTLCTDRDARSIRQRSWMRGECGRSPWHREEQARRRGGQARCTSGHSGLRRRIANRTQAMFRSEWRSGCCVRRGGSDGLADEVARDVVRSRVPGADAADLLLLLDELGIRDSTDPLPDIAPDARRRRLTALVNASMVAREEPAVFVIEDAHWIDATSESLLCRSPVGCPAGLRAGH